MPVVLGGPNARSVRLVGDMVVAYQYVNGEPALVIWPKRKRVINARGCVICLSAAHKYADDNYLVQKAFQMAEYLGMGTEISTVRRIAHLINDSLVDLVRMKPEPQQPAKVIGEGRLIGAHGRPIDFELTDEHLRNGPH